MESITAVQGKHGPEVGGNNSPGFRNASLLKKKEKATGAGRQQRDLTLGMDFHLIFKARDS